MRDAGDDDDGDDEVLMKGRTAFLPWLQLRDRARFGEFEFIPFLDADDHVSPELAAIDPILRGILSSYKTLDNRPLPNCTFVVQSGNWHLRLADGTRVETAVAALFLAARSANEYLCQGGEYANWSMFELVVQEFDHDGSGPITLLAKRRDGTTQTGGYDHGEVIFSQPPHCAVTSSVAFEPAFLAALERAAAADGSDTFPLIEAALGFLTQASTDLPGVDAVRELISTATAFEQLFDARSDKLRLATRFGDLFAPFVGHTTAEALVNRPGIYITADHADVQRQWPVHQKWVHELYQVRSKAAHRRDVRSLPWGWSPYEHLLMGAWVFPLAVKLKLAAEGHYVLTLADRGRCLSIDRLLIETDWDGVFLEDGRWQRRHPWNKIVAETREELMWREASEGALRDLEAAARSDEAQER